MFSLIFSFFFVFNAMFVFFYYFFLLLCVSFFLFVSFRFPFLLQGILEMPEENGYDDSTNVGKEYTTIALHCPTLHSTPTPKCATSSYNNAFLNSITNTSYSSNTTTKTIIVVFFFFASFFFVFF